jgi:hypothetical protein
MGVSSAGTPSGGGSGTLENSPLPAIVAMAPGGIDTVATVSARRVGLSARMRWFPKSLT